MGNSVPEHLELRDWQRRKSPSLRKFLHYGGLALIPVVLLLLLAHRP